MKYSDWLDEWYKNYIEPTAKHNTKYHYTIIIEKRLKPALGKYEPDELTPRVLQRFVTELLTFGNRRTGRGLATNSVIGIVNAIQASLKLAYETGELKNYTADKIRLPKADVLWVKGKAEADAMKEKGEYYAQQRMYDVLEKAASNESSVGGNSLIGAGVGLGVGLGVGGGFGSAIGGMMNNAFNRPQPTQGAQQNVQGAQQNVQSGAEKCPSCGTDNPQGARFCSGCGASLAPKKIFCPSCGAENPQGARFCSGCGFSFVPQKIKCPSCGAELNANAKFCSVCGAKID